MFALLPRASLTHTRFLTETFINVKICFAKLLTLASLGKVALIENILNNVRLHFQSSKYYNVCLKCMNFFSRSAIKFAAIAKINCYERKKKPHFI